MSNPEDFSTGYSQITFAEDHVPETRYRGDLNQLSAMSYPTTLPITYEKSSNTLRPQATKIREARERFNIKRAALLGTLHFVALAGSIEVVDVLLYHHLTRQMSVDQALAFGAPYALILGVASAVYTGITQGRRTRS